MDGEQLKQYMPIRKKIGNYRVEKLRIEYEAKGYKVTTFPIEAQGLDMICENDAEVLGIEITNWNERGYLNLDRFTNMVQNWNDLEYRLRHNKDHRDYRRILVYSYSTNIENLIPYLLDAKVELKKIGRQDLPEDLTEEQLKGWEDND